MQTPASDNTPIVHHVRDPHLQDQSTSTSARRPGLAARRKSSARISPYTLRPFPDEVDEQLPFHGDASGLGGKFGLFAQSPVDWLSDSSHSRSNSVSSASSANSSSAWSDVDSARISMPEGQAAPHYLFSAVPDALHKSPSSSSSSSHIPSFSHQDPFPAVGYAFHHQGAPAATLPLPSGAGLDPHLSGFAKTIRSVNGSNSSTERAKNNFVHTWSVCDRIGCEDWH